MKTIRITVYSFSELKKDVQEKVIQKYFSEHAFHYVDDYIASMSAGLEWFGFNLDNSSIDPIYASKGTFSFSDNPEVDNDIQLIGTDLSIYLAKRWDLDKVLAGNCPFTGCCYDEDFLDPLRAFIKKPQNFNFVFLLKKCCINLLKALEKDCEYQQTIEYFTEFSEVNEFMYLENGIQLEKTLIKEKERMFYAT